MIDVVMHQDLSKILYTGKFSLSFFFALSPTLSAVEFKVGWIPFLQIISRFASGQIQDGTNPFASVEERKITRGKNNP